MNEKERIDYLLTKVPEDKKEAFVEDLKGITNLEEGLSVLKKYGICRICFRELAYKGEIPGVKKASW